MDKSTARVNEAVAICVRRFLETTENITNRSAYSQAVGKRIQGSYGAELRKIADAQPLLSANELFCTVIAKVEFPYDAEAERIASTITAGARDRARKRNYGDPVDLSIPIPDDLSDRVSELRALIGDEPPIFTPPARFVVDRENPRVVPKFVYEAAKR